MIIEGIVLAAGLSSRAGTYKLTLDFHGKMIIERCIEGMYDSCSRIILVGGHNVDCLVPIVNKYPKVELIYNDHYISGMFSSVITGFKNIKGHRTFLIPGDYPLVSPSIYQKLLDEQHDIIIPTYKGIKGHPILISRNISDMLLSTSKYQTLRDFINFQDYHTIEVNSPSILKDIDTKEDYIKAKTYSKNLIKGEV